MRLSDQSTAIIHGYAGVVVKDAIITSSGAATNFEADNVIVPVVAVDCILIRLGIAVDVHADTGIAGGDIVDELHSTAGIAEDLEADRNSPSTYFPSRFRYLPKC